MSRWRTHNNRRRARELKAGGLFTLQLHPMGPTWADSGASPFEIIDQLKTVMMDTMRVPPHLISNGR